MEAKENWISPEGYSLNINQLNQDIISGNFEVNLNDEHLFIPFEGLIHICYGHQMEFCFVVDWHFYVGSGTCYTSFVGKNYFEESIEHISLKWLLVHEMNRPEKQNLPITGRNKFIKDSEKVNNHRLNNESNNVPYPFLLM